ncbi:MAG: peptidoglycan-binding protein LysM [Candidatus Binatia bacterium]
MGLFDFVRNVGKKIFSRDDEAADKLKAEIEAANPGVSGLGVQYDSASGKVTLSGAAESAEAMQKAVLIAGNAQGVGEVEVTQLQHPAEKEKVEYYVIQSGDNLSKIAKQFYGDPNKYPRIFEANREVIKDANLIFPGQKIRIPLD